ncbi:TPA: hypothetical protein N0F65_009323, partial [Lagenidium giganteum]
MHMSSPDATYSQWIVRLLPNGKIGLETFDTRRFVARCNGCHKQGAYPDAAFGHVDDLPSAP